MWKIILLILVILYVLNPYDILPDLIIGWGWLDDLVILGLLWRYFYSRKRKRFNYERFFQQSQSAYGNKQGNSYSREKKSEGHSQYMKNSTPWDPYQILGVDTGASLNEIKQAYRDLANKYHPDKVEYLGDEFKILAEKRFKEIQKAYQELAKK
ncbi:MAG: DnaJ domain-containing protein [bacterium]